MITMSLGFILLFIASYFILHGAWRLYVVGMYEDAYYLYKLGNENMLDYLVRELGYFYLRVFKRLKLHKLYASQFFKTVRVSFGVFQITLGLILIYLILFVRNSEFASYLTIKL